jgi:hypothetical protein
LPTDAALTVSPDLWDRAQAIKKALKSAGLSIVTAESCTAGMIAAVLSRADGAGEVLHGGFVTYTKGPKDFSPRRLCGPAARKERGQRRSRDATRNRSTQTLAGLPKSRRQRRARAGGGRGRQSRGTGLFLLREVGRTAGRRERRIWKNGAGAAFAAHDRARFRTYRVLPRRMPRLIGTTAARRACHSSSVLEAFERLHGLHAVARLVRALEPPRLKGTIWSPASGCVAPQ